MSDKYKQTSNGNNYYYNDTKTTIFIQVKGEVVAYPITRLSPDGWTDDRIDAVVARDSQ